MTTHSLLETIQRIVRDEVARLRTAELAVVQEQHTHASDSDQDNYACTVALRNSGIVLRQVPCATSRLGFAGMHDVGDLVCVQFIGGDINHPIITGSFYSDEDRPPANDDGQLVLHLPLGSGDSDALHFELHSSDKREVILKLGDSLQVNLRDDDPVVEITVGGGRASLRIESDGAVTLESQGGIDMKGAEINVEAQGKLNLKGATVNIN